MSGAGRRGTVIFTVAIIIVAAVASVGLIAVMPIVLEAQGQPPKETAGNSTAEDNNISSDFGNDQQQERQQQYHTGRMQALLALPSSSLTQSDGNNTKDNSPANNRLNDDNNQNPSSEITAIPNGHGGYANVTISRSPLPHKPTPSQSNEDDNNGDDNNNKTDTPELPFYNNTWIHCDNEDDNIFHLKPYKCDTSDNGNNQTEKNSKPNSPKVIQGTNGNDILNGTEGTDEIRGHLGNDVIHGYDGNDDLYGDEGDDSIYGGSGNDKIHAWTDDNYADGGPGDDFMIGDGDGLSGKHVNTFYGGPGDDTIKSQDAVGLLHGGDGADNIEIAGETGGGAWGDAGNDRLSLNTDIGGGLYGGKGNDMLTISDEGYMDGGEGNDYLKASGYDIEMTGGDGADTFDCSKPSSSSSNDGDFWNRTVTDFDKSDGDVLIGSCEHVIINSTKETDLGAGSFDNDHHGNADKSVRHGTFVCNGVTTLDPAPGTVCVGTDLPSYRINQNIIINGSVIGPYSLGDEVKIEIHLPDGSIYHRSEKEIKQGGVFGPIFTSIGGSKIEANPTDYYGSYSVTATYENNQYESKFDIVSNEEWLKEQDQKMLTHILFSIKGVNMVSFGRMDEKIIIVGVEDESVSLPKEINGYMIVKESVGMWHVLPYIPPNQNNSSPSSSLPSPTTNNNNSSSLEGQKGEEQNATNTSNATNSFPSIRLDSLGLSSVSQVKVVNSSVYLLGHTKDGSVALIRSNDGGITFGRPEIILSPDKRYYDAEPIMAVSGPNIYVVLSTDDNDNNSDTGAHSILFARSNDGGKSFSDAITFDKGQVEHGAPYIAASGNLVLIAWVHGGWAEEGETGNITLIKSDDGGKTFGNKMILDKNAHAPLLMAIDKNDNNAIYISWKNYLAEDDFLDSEGSTQHLVKSIDGGNTFEEVKGLSEFGNATIRELGTISENEGGGLYIAIGAVPRPSGYYYNITHTGHIAFAKSNNGGESFRDITILDKLQNDNDDDLHQPHPNVDGLSIVTGINGNIYILSKDSIFQLSEDGYTQALGEDIKFRKSDDGGKSFSAPVEIDNSESIDDFKIPTNAAYYTIGPSTKAVTFSGNTIFIAYDRFNDTQNRSGVYFAKSFDGGSSFSLPAPIIENKTGSSMAETSFENIFATSTGGVYVIWTNSSGWFLTNINGENVPQSSSNYAGNKTQLILDRPPSVINASKTGVYRFTGRLVLVDPDTHKRIDDASGILITIKDNDPLNPDDTLAVGKTYDRYGDFAVRWMPVSTDIDNVNDIYATAKFRDKDVRSDEYKIRITGDRSDNTGSQSSIILNKPPGIINATQTPMYTFTGRLMLVDSLTGYSANPKGTLVTIKDRDSLNPDDTLAIGIVSDDAGDFSAVWIPISLDGDGTNEVYATVKYEEKDIDSNQYNVKVVGELDPPEGIKSLGGKPYIRILNNHRDKDNVNVLIQVDKGTYGEASEYLPYAVDAINDFSARLKEKSSSYDKWNFNVRTSIGPPDPAQTRDFPVDITILLAGDPYGRECTDHGGVTQMFGNFDLGYAKVLTSCYTAKYGYWKFYPSDVYNTVTHEFAHLLGLGHTFNLNGDLMCSYERTWLFGKNYYTCPNDSSHDGGSYTLADYHLNAIIDRMYGIDGFAKPNPKLGNNAYYPISDSDLQKQLPPVTIVMVPETTDRTITLAINDTTIERIESVLDSAKKDFGEAVGVTGVGFDGQNLVVYVADESVEIPPKYLEHDYMGLHVVKVVGGEIPLSSSDGVNAASLSEYE